MKELEEKIINAVAKNASSGILSISQSVLKAIEPTVKDISIEFAEFIRLNATEIPDGWQVNGKIYTSKELLDKFIKQRYATP